MADSPSRTVETLFEEGQAAWPRLALPREDFERYLAEHALAPAEVPAAIAADLFVACACANRVKGAAEAFMKRYDRDIRIAVARIDRSPSFYDEVTQSLSESLLVGTDRPRIAQYAGRGPLGAWVAMSARRLAGRLAHGGHTASPLDEETMALEALGPESDPSLFYLKKRYGQEVRQALIDAFAALAAQDKMMMRLFLVEKMTMEAIGRVLELSQPTISRRLRDVRIQVTATAKRHLHERLGASAEEIESLIRLVQSQVEIRFSRILS
jgi:RNA polymerase sigma-70 factor (ECF subfamily)